MSTMASQIASVSIIYSTVCWGPDKKHRSSASLAFVREIHRWPVNFPHKGPVTRKMFPFDDVTMTLGSSKIYCRVYIFHKHDIEFGSIFRCSVRWNKPAECLTHWSRVTSAKLGHQKWFRWWLVACSAPSHHLKQFRVILNWQTWVHLKWRLYYLGLKELSIRIRTPFCQPGDDGSQSCKHVGSQYLPVVLKGFLLPPDECVITELPTDNKACWYPVTHLPETTRLLSIGVFLISCGATLMNREQLTAQVA